MELPELPMDIIGNIILHYDLDTFYNVFMLNKAIYQYCNSLYFIQHKISMFIETPNHFG